MNAVVEVEKVKPQTIRLRELPKLTEKQAAFVDGILAGKTKSDAYRDAYDAENCSERVIWREACVLAKHHKVSAWLDWMRIEQAEDAQCTLNSHLYDLKRIRDIATVSGEFGAAVSAEKARGSAAGLHNKHATITHMNLESIGTTKSQLPGQVIEATAETIEDQ